MGLSLKSRKTLYEVVIASDIAMGLIGQNSLTRIGTL